MASPTIFNRAKLSGAAAGNLPIKVTTVASPGDIIHTAVAGNTANTFDEVWLWAVNSDPTARKITLEVGSTTVPDSHVEFTVPPESGLFIILPGISYQNGAVIRCFCALANVVMIHGHINEIRP